MASKADFTPEEWKTIVAAAPMVGLAVTCASPNGPWGVMKEMLSMGMAMAEMLQKASSNPLIAELAADLSASASDVTHPLLETRPEVKNSLLLVICSNRGLCGGYNAAILREANHRLRQIQAGSIEARRRRGRGRLEWSDGRPIDDLDGQGALNRSNWR